MSRSSHTFQPRGLQIYASSYAEQHSVCGRVLCKNSKDVVGLYFLPAQLFFFFVWALRKIDRDNKRTFTIVQRGPHIHGRSVPEGNVYSCLGFLKSRDPTESAVPLFPLLVKCSKKAFFHFWKIVTSSFLTLFSYKLHHLTRIGTFSLSI